MPRGLLLLMLYLPVTAAAGQGVQQTGLPLQARALEGGLGRPSFSLNVDGIATSVPGVFTVEDRSALTVPPPHANAPGEGRKNPLVALGLSYLSPGAGQFYNGEPRKAWIAFGLVVGGSALGIHGMFGGGAESEGIVGVLIAVSSWTWQLIDAPVSAHRINKRRQTQGPGAVLEFSPEPARVGLNPVTIGRGRGMRLTLHF